MVTPNALLKKVFNDIQIEEEKKSKKKNKATTTTKKKQRQKLHINKN